MCVRVWGAKQTVPLPVDPSSCTRGDGRAVFPNRQEIPSFCPCLCVRLASSFSVSVSCTHTHTLAHKRVSRPHCQANTSPALPRVCTPENHNFSVCRKCPLSLSFSLSLSLPSLEMQPRNTHPVAEQRDMLALQTERFTGTSRGPLSVRGPSCSRENTCAWVCRRVHARVHAGSSHGRRVICLSLCWKLRVYC